MNDYSEPRGLLTWYTVRHSLATYQTHYRITSNKHPWVVYGYTSSTQPIPSPTPIQRRCIDAPNGKFSQSRIIASQRKATYIIVMYTTSVFHKSAISDPWPNPHWKQKFSTHYQPNPTHGSTQPMDNSETAPAFTRTWTSKTRHVTETRRLLEHWPPVVQKVIPRF